MLEKHINHVPSLQHGEAMAVEAFTRAIAMATQAFMENPMATPLIPNWNRGTSAIPGIFEMLKMAVDADNQ